MDITTNFDDHEITKAIVAMGQSLKLKVLAEGVETVEQLDIQRGFGCDYIQGWYYSKALSAAQVTPYLRNRYLINNKQLELIA